MPRKEPRHWDKDGVVPVEDHSYRADSESMREIFQVLGLNPERADCGQLRDDISQIGSDFLIWRASKATTVSRASARAAINDTLELKPIRAAHINALNVRAGDAVFDALIADEKINPGQGVTKMQLWKNDRLSDLEWRRVLNTARRHLASKAGADENSELLTAVARLVSVYEALTGRPARRNNTGTLRSYSQRSRSDAGEFVTHWMQKFDASLREETIAGALKKVLEKHKKS
jgi:hypothetical protein